MFENLPLLDDSNINFLYVSQQIRLKNSNPENLILNGRAAVCAGRDDMSSEEEDNDENDHEERTVGHRFAQPEEFDFKLESGAIPDAAMIHAARKRRQKAREQGKQQVGIFITLHRHNVVTYRGDERCLL